VEGRGELGLGGGGGRMRLWKGEVSWGRGEEGREGKEGREGGGGRRGKDE
jgi:hypothetical protein